jgi:glycosyltransferase involved in cell wall biosynthesis
MAKKTPELSVIIPVYNREKFIEKCVRSIMAQSFKDLEIIVVNDGSTDSSRDIVANLAKKDTRIKIVDEPQSGVATARANGLKAAHGTYIMWCDSDDFFDKTMCAEMVAAIKKERVDVVACGMKIVYQTKKDQHGIEDYVKLKFKGKQKLTLDVIVRTDVSLPTKIFKKSIIDKYGISFPLGLHFEDAYFCDLYFAAADSIFFLDRELYNYVRHDASIMSTSFAKSPVALDYLEVAFREFRFLKKHKLLERRADLFFHRFIQFYAFAFDNSTLKNRSHVRRRALAFIRKARGELALADPHIQKDLLKLLRFGRGAKMTLAKNRYVRGAYLRLKPYAKKILRR